MSSELARTQIKRAHHRLTRLERRRVVSREIRAPSSAESLSLPECTLCPGRMPGALFVLALQK
jgi:hypothetical protein